MDVRCENCGTEYELDERKLKPGGVTVKCTQCDHMFKVRRRMPTAVGVAAATPRARPRSSKQRPRPMFEAQPTTPMAVVQARSEPRVSPRPRTESGPGGRARPSPEVRQPASPSPVPDALRVGDPGRERPSSGPHEYGRQATGGKERVWLIRLPSGAVETCRELATLQQWIIAGKINRNSGISRNGKTWKPLGEIKELTQFFDIAEEAQRARQERVSPRVSPSGMTGEPPPLAVPDKFDPTATTLPMETADVPAPMSGARGGTAPAAGQPAAWAGDLHAADAGPQGPVGGVARRVTGDMAAGDVAFAGSRMVTDPSALDASFAGGSARGSVQGSPGGSVQGSPGGSVQGSPGGSAGGWIDDDEDIALPRSSAARWIVVLSLFLMVGAAVVVYALVFRTDSDPIALADQDAGLDGGSDSVTPESSDAGADTPAPTSRDGILASVVAVLGIDERKALTDLEGKLAGLPGADSDRELLLARARVHTAIAQHLFDAADQLDADQRKQVTRRAQQRVLDALTLGKKALQKDDQDPDAQVLMADILRLQGKPAGRVESYLDRALALDPAHRDARLVRALLEARENRVPRARKLLTELAGSGGGPATTGDFRPLYRLALLDLADKDYPAARKRADEIVGAKPEHSGARALLARIDEATRVDTTDPLPPEVGDGDGDGDGDGSAGGSYRSLLDRANRKAENGDCRGAMDLYERALDAEPTSVDALTGMGYCHIDRRQFSSAHDKFKAALVVSPRHQEAMWGIAEAYQQQGLASQAITAYKRFLEAHPVSARASSAKRQIKNLGGSLSDGSGGDPAGNGDDDDTGAGGDSDGSDPDGSSTGGGSGGSDSGTSTGGDSSGTGDESSGSGEGSTPLPSGDEPDEPASGGASGGDAADEADEGAGTL